MKLGENEHMIYPSRDVLLPQSSHSFLSKGQRKKHQARGRKPGVQLS